VKRKSNCGSWLAYFSDLDRQHPSRDGRCSELSPFLCPAIGYHLTIPVTSSYTKGHGASSTAQIGSGRAQFIQPRRLGRVVPYGSKVRSLSPGSLLFAHFSKRKASQFTFAEQYRRARRVKRSLTRLTTCLKFACPIRKEARITTASTFLGSRTSLKMFIGSQ
jgi:hypothetical protein